MWETRCLIGILLCWAVALPGEDEAATVRISLPAQTELPRLADLVSEFCNVSVQYDPQRVRGQVRLAVRDELDRTQLWDLFNQVLIGQGFTTVVGGMPPIYRVVQLPQAIELGVIMTDEELAALPVPPGYVALVVTLDHIGTDAAIRSLTGLFAGKLVEAKVFGREQRMLLAGFAPKVAEARRLLAVLDQPGQVPMIEVWRPQRSTPAALHVAATAAWNALDRLSAGRRPAEIQISPDSQALLLIAVRDQMPALRQLVSELDASEPQETRTYRPRFFPIAEVAQLIGQVLQAEVGADEVRVVQDRLTNALLINATAADHQRIAALIDTLDATPEEARRQVRRFVIRNRQVEDLASVLGQMVRTGIIQGSLPEDPTEDDQSATVSASRAGARSATGERDQQPALVLTTDPQTNTIIALGDPRLLAQVERLISELDVRQPQVEISVVMVQLTRTQEREVGVELAQMFRHNKVTGSVSSLFGLSGANPGQTLADRSFNNPSGFSSMVINPGDFAGVVRALESVSDGQSMVQARMVVNNNTEANLKGVAQQPYSAINTGDSTTTTGFGGTLDAGTQISVTPQISAGDHVTVLYQIEQSSFGSGGGDTAGGVLPPPKRADTVSSTATVPDSFVIALGGLTQTNEQLVEARVPLLGRIPVLGLLFRHTKTTQADSRFYVFIRANVLRHAAFEDLRFLSEHHREAADVEDDQWPVLEPQLMP